jgi:hypothetical protein
MYRINRTRKEMWLIAANDNLPDDDWSWEVVMLLAHSSREERWDMEPLS